MLDADNFESAFRSADKRRFQLNRPEISSVMILSDLEGSELEEFGIGLKRFLGVLGKGVRWGSVGGDQHQDISEAVQLVERSQPDLICTYRNMKSDAWKWPFSLGGYVNVLTRATELPILVVPHPLEVSPKLWQDSDTDSVLVATDHLAGDDAMVNWGARLTREQGVLHLAHIEDDGVFERYLDAISKIEGINTEFARNAIMEQLHKEPREYTATCQEALAAAGHGFGVEPQIRNGRSLQDYQNLIAEHEIDLLILRATEGGQLAMHGASYLLAVELRQTPLLMI
ncbi:MAG: hypothetical protein HRU17_18705 [Polyangiaceae bacterium]|nr:hypothetical protein [Polyangiaceae bacterium]